MKADYEAIAGRFDDNPARHRIGPDPVIASASSVLDVGCGTGIWLDVQRRAWPGRRWCGIDPSQAMLARARERLGDVSGGDGRVGLVEGKAERLPWDDGAFDVVSCRFALHHLDDLEVALDELCRVAADVVVVENLAFAQASRWWAYQVWPEALAIDAGRFPSVDHVHDALEARGAAVRTTVTSTRWRISATEALGDAERRDASQLAMLPDPVYERGLDWLRAAAAQGRTLDTAFAMMRCEAHVSDAVTAP